jgi:hypothetical protein
MSTLTIQRETVADEKPFVVKLRQQKPNPEPGQLRPLCRLAAIKSSRVTAL